MKILIWHKSSQGNAAATTLAKDTFTDVNGTSLSAHTMDVGSGWTLQATSAIHIENNQADVVTAAGIGYAIATVNVGQSDVTVSALVTPEAVGGASATDLVARFTDMNNFWLIQPYGTGFVIYQVQSGSFTMRASASIGYSAGTQYPLSVTCSGQTITATFNNTTTIQYTSAAFNQTAQVHGIAGGTAGDLFDSFLVTHP